MPDNFGDKRNTAGFRQHPEHIGKGRKKKIYTILKEKGYSADDIKTAFGEMAFYTIPELKKVYNDESKPVIARIVANQFYLALKKGDWSKIKEILEHVIGKAAQKIEQKIEMTEDNLTDEELDQKIDEIIRKRKAKNK